MKWNNTMNEKIRTFIRARYIDKNERLRLTPDEHKQLKRAFRGGLTHANPVNVRELGQCEFIDKNSVYENVLCTATYPLN